MILIDYIVMNFDRHLKNYGIIRNVETLEWKKTTPIFDTGESMQCDKLTSEINFYDGTCKFFTNTNKKISDLLEFLDLEKYNFEKLQDIPDLFNEVLLKYQNYTDMSDERIDKLYNGLNYRINYLIGKKK